MSTTTKKRITKSDQSLKISCGNSAILCTSATRKYISCVQPEAKVSNLNKIKICTHVFYTNPAFCFRTHLLTHWSFMDDFLMDGYTIWSFDRKPCTPPLHCDIIKLERARIFPLTPSVFSERKSYTTA